MKCHKGVRREAGHSATAWSWRLAVLCALAVGSRASAQSVLVPPTTFSGNVPGPLVPGPGDIGGLGQDGGPTFLGNGGIFQWGPVHVHPHFFYRLSYSDGLQASAGQPSQTIIQAFSPGVTMQLGTKWSLDYTPTMYFYSDPKFTDTVDQSVSFSGRTEYEDWSLGLSQNYSSSTQPLVETGGVQTSQESFNTSASASYRLNSDTSIELTAAQRLRYTATFTDSAQWSTMNWLNHQIWPRVSGAIGLGLTYDDVSAGADMFSEQIRGRINVNVGSKLNLSFSTGIELRQIMDSSAPSPINPVFSLSAQYQMFEHTSLSINASRQTSTSLFRNQITENTDVNIGLSQRLFGRVQLSLGAGYRLSDFQSTSSSLAVAREDTSTHVTARLSVPIRQRVTVSTFFSYSQNQSSAGGFTYSNKESGFEVSYNF